MNQDKKTTITLKPDVLRTAYRVYAQSAHRLRSVRFVSILLFNLESTYTPASGFQDMFQRVIDRYLSSHAK